MDKNYFKAIDNLTASETAVEKALSAARAEQQSGKVIPMKTITRKFTALGLIAASLALVIALGAIFFPPAKTARETAKNSFLITANAAELKNKLSDKSVIGAFQGSSYSASLVDLDGVDRNSSDLGQLYKDGYADLFMLYDMSTLSVNGKNIKSVTVKSNKKGIYFGVTPIGDIVESRNADGDITYVYINGKAVPIEEKTYEEYKKSCEKKRKNYTDTDSLKNSQYTEKELKKYGDGLYADFFCDGFTYKNVNKEKSVDIGGDLDLVVESDHSDKKIAKLLKKLEKAGKEAMQEKYVGEAHEKMEKLYNEVNNQIVKETVKGATIDVKVSFTDGTSQTRTLRLAYDTKSDPDFPWVTIK